MKNSIIFIWGIIVITLVSGVFAIGIYEQKNEERLNVERTFKTAAKEYLKEHEDKVPTSDREIIIKYEDLKKEEFIDKVAYYGKECTGSVTVRKNILFYKYIPNIICEWTD